MIENLEHPFGIVLIAGISFINGFWILLLLASNSMYLASAGLMISALFIASGYFLLKMNNFARTIIIMLFLLGVILDLSNESFGLTQLFSISISTSIIYYLLSQRISKLFTD